jgi:hypothetical protein
MNRDLTIAPFACSTVRENLKKRPSILPPITHGLREIILAAKTMMKYRCDLESGGG